jgi:hypothetical protein
MDFAKLSKRQKVALSVLSLVLLYLAVRYLVAYDLVETRQRLHALEQTQEQTLAQLAEQKTRAAVAEREVDVVRAANELLRKSELERQDEIAALQADLAFYRRLGGANGSQAPLAVHYLEVQATQSPRVFRLIFTLTQNLRWAAIIAGRVELGVEGIIDGAARTISQDDLLDDSAEPLLFRFKYFQQIERLMTLPEGFEPSRLSIRLKSDSLRAPVEQSMPWETLFNQAAEAPLATDGDSPDD